ALGIIKDHPLVGIGKGSEAKLRSSLELYGGGRLPPGHFHSSLIQIATWWGLPALMFYGSMVALLLLMARRVPSSLRRGPMEGGGDRSRHAWRDLSLQRQLGLSLQLRRRRGSDGSLACRRNSVRRQPVDPWLRRSGERQRRNCSRAPRLSSSASASRRLG